MQSPGLLTSVAGFFGGVVHGPSESTKVFRIAVDSGRSLPKLTAGWSRRTKDGR
jgi:hypothetical protein